MNVVYYISANIFFKINEIIDEYHDFLDEAGRGLYEFTNAKEIGKFLKRCDEIKKRENKEYEPICFTIDFSGTFRCLGRQIIVLEHLPDDNFIMIADNTVVLKKTQGDIQEEMVNEYKNYVRSLIAAKSNPS